MSADWKELTREAGFHLEAGLIRVPCGRDRFHKVNVDDSNVEAIRLWSMVVTSGNAPANATLQAWKMNRFRELIGFKAAERGRIIGECWIPKGRITADEWRTYVFTLARSCDQLEYLWTGKDVE